MGKFSGKFSYGDRGVESAPTVKALDSHLNKSLTPFLPHVILGTPIYTIKIFWNILVIAKEKFDQTNIRSSNIHN